MVYINTSKRIISMKYKIKDVGEIELTTKDFLADGGEGNIYAKGQNAYKIFKDISKMPPVAKIQELSVLTHPNIIKPQNIILDKNNTPVGYSMRLVKGMALCQLFPKAFKLRHNLTNDKVLSLVEEFYDMIQFVHRNNVLVVDLNEMNFLVNDTFKEIYAIDTNSYQTRSFPATVIMESIRDRHCKHFSKESDWFSWGILTFQMLIGIHPYKGNHPKVQHLPRTEWLNYRMVNNLSVFNAKASFPAFCESFNVIPSGLRQWYKAVFEDGKRLEPPKNFDGKIEISAIKEIVGGNLFDIKEIDKFKDNISKIYAHHDSRLIVTNNLVYFKNSTYHVPKVDQFVFIPGTNKPLAVFIENEMVKVFDIIKQEYLPLSCNGKALMQCNHVVYIQNGTNILSLEFVKFGESINCVVKVVGTVMDMPNATKVFDGVIIQNLLGGHYYVSIFPKLGFCHQVSMPELDSYKIIDAKYENKVLMIVGIKNGIYDRLVIRFDDEFKYDVRKIENIVYNELNFTVNEAGICVAINEEEKVEAFANKKDTPIKIIDDFVISNDMRLCHDGTKILFIQNKKLYSLSMK